MSKQRRLLGGAKAYLKKITKTYKQNKKWFKATTDILQAIHYAKDANGFAMGLTGFSAVGSLLSAATKEKDSAETLQELGLVSVVNPEGLGKIIFGTLLHRKSRSYKTHNLWVEEDIPYAAATKDLNGKFLSLHSSSAATPILKKVFQEELWRNGHHQVISVLVDAGRWGFPQYNFEFSSYDDSKTYLRERSAFWYAERLKTSEIGRTILLCGKSGAGKSLLAGKIAKSIYGTETKTIRIHCDVAAKLSFHALPKLIDYTGANCLIIDDLDVSRKDRTETLLNILEELNRKNCTIILTMMLSPDIDTTDLSPGSWYFPGMRPDRIDDIFFLSDPNENERLMLIAKFLDTTQLTNEQVKRIVEETEGMPCAYVIELIKRIDTFGFDCIERETKLVKSFAPINTVEEDEEDSSTE